MITRTRIINVLAALAGIALASILTQADSDASSGSRPQLAVTERTFDFGRVPQNASVAHGFWLKNTGGDTLRIDDVKPSCGCTKAPLTKKVLPAGDSTMVNVIFATGHHNSPVHKTASVICNSAGPIPLLDFTADVHRSMDSINTFQVDPYRVDLDDDWRDSGSNHQGFTITVHNLANTDLTFAMVAPPQNHAEADFPDGLTIGRDQSKSFTLSFEPGMSDELFTESLTLEASDPSHTRITIPIVKARRWGPAPLSVR